MHSSYLLILDAVAYAWLISTYVVENAASYAEITQYDSTLWPSL